MAATVTATSDIPNARVQLDVRGAVDGEVFYLLRRDQNGIVLVRDTSQATVTAQERVIHRNLVLDPSATGTTLHTVTAATKSTVSSRLRVTSTATTGVSVAPQGAGTSSRMPSIVGDRVAARVGLYGHATKTLYARSVIEAYTAGGALLGIVAQSAWTTVAPLAILALELYGTNNYPTSATIVYRIDIAGTNIGGALTAIGDWMEFDNFRVDSGTSVQTIGPFPGMPGDQITGGTPTMYYRWTGTANASVSEGYTYGQVIYDYEARQKMLTDYILTDEDGIELASTTITTGAWGTWLKHLGKPFLNTKVLWNEDSDYTRPANRSLLRARGAKFPIALHDRRGAPTGSIKVATESDETARAFTTLMDDGAVIMIDVSPEFGVPIRYVSVGDVSGGRIMPAGRGLKVKARVWTLQVDEVAAPVGLTAGQGFTYANIGPLYGSYAAIPATTASYVDLSVGEQS